MDDDAEAKGRVAAMLAELTGIERLDPDADIFELGLVNSLTALQIVLRLEQRFGLTIGDEDLDRANFASVAGMARFVARKRRGALASTP